MERLVAVERRRQVRRREGDGEQKGRGGHEGSPLSQPRRRGGQPRQEHRQQRDVDRVTLPDEPQRLDRKPGRAPRRRSASAQGTAAAGVRHVRLASCTQGNHGARRRGSTPAAASRAAGSAARCRRPPPPGPPLAAGSPARTRRGRTPAGSRASVRPATPQTASRPDSSGAPHRARWGSVCATWRRTSGRSCDHSAVSTPARSASGAPASRTVATVVPVGTPPRWRASGPARRRPSDESGRVASGARP